MARPKKWPGELAPQICVRMPVSMVRRLELYAAKYSKAIGIPVNRMDVLRKAIEVGMAEIEKT